MMWDRTPPPKPIALVCACGYTALCMGKKPKIVKKGEPGYDEYKEYMRKYVLDRHHKRSAKYKQLLGGKCVQCGSVDNLQFDHILPRQLTGRSGKKHILGSLFASGSESKILDELQYCQLLCELCHTQKSILDSGRQPAKCGTRSGYRYCKCELCTKAHSAYCAEYRRKRKQRNSTF